MLERGHDQIVQMPAVGRPEAVRAHRRRIVFQSLLPFDRAVGGDGEQSAFAEHDDVVVGGRGTLGETRTEYLYRVVAQVETPVFVKTL